MKSLRLTICFLLLLGAACFAQNNYAVLVQESPPGAGEITNPGTGVHTFNVNDTVNLATIAKPGWRFAYWLGDVSNPTANRTMLSINGPKIVIAVFQRDEYQFPFPEMQAEASNGPEGLIKRYDEIGGDLGSGMMPVHTAGGGGSNNPKEPPDKPPPVTPEPATVLLLGIGAGLITVNKKK